jgi:hypothetical protein
MAAYGPKASTLAGESADGFILQLADPDIVALDDHAAARRGGGRHGPESFTVCVAAPAYVGDDLAHQRDQCRWFGGMVGNHVADIVERYGTSPRPFPGADRLHQGPRRATTTATTDAPATPDTEFVPDEIIDRFCLLGPVERHVERLAELRGSASTSSRSTSCTTIPKGPCEAYAEHIIGHDHHTNKCVRMRHVPRDDVRARPTPRRPPSPRLVIRHALE